MQLDQVQTRPAASIDTARFDALARAKAGDLLTAADLRDIFKIGRTRYFELQKDGVFDKFKVKDQIGPGRYSGALVQQHLDGDEVLRRPTTRRRRRR